MIQVRAAGLLLGLVFILFNLRPSRRVRLTRAEWFGWLLFGTALSVLSVFPALTGVLADTLRLRNRLFALLVTSTVTLFVLRLRDVRRLRTLEERFGQLVRNLAVREFQSKGAEAGDSGRIAIVIAAYNEADAIGGVLTELPREVEGLAVEPIVVVDGGEDQTETVVRHGGHLVVAHTVNRGQGDALRTGFKVAFQRRAEIVVTMDADGQHAPDELIELIKPILADEADYVQGSRFAGRYDDAGGARDIGIRIFTLLINRLSGARITDCTNGYRAIRGDKLALLRLEEDRFSAPELIMEAASKGLRMKEVPVHIRTRVHGQSKKPRRLGYPLGFLRTIVRVWLR